jgi:alpha-L-rhamnosidase
MTQKEMFSHALWLGAAEPKPASVYFLRGRFAVRGVKTAVLRAVGLGFFECFINGVRVGEDRFLPLNSDYEPRKDYPAGETLSGHRLWVPEYDVAPYLRDGENVIVLHFGGGWYDRPGESGFGFAKAIWRVSGEDAGGPFDFFSSAADRISPSFVAEYDLIHFETHDYRMPAAGAAALGFNDAGWPHAVPVPGPDTDYGVSDCPPDRVCRVIAPVRLAPENNVYDCGVNLTGTPVLRLLGGAGERVTVTMAEERTPEGDLDPAYIHGQRLTFVCGETPVTARALFTWFGFRYFTVEGPAEVLSAEEIHTDVKRIAGFESDNETLNWIFEAYVTTQLMNMHAGIPSDCPHKERRGYTGDGQLACRAAMTALAAEAFYRKWIFDIADCQDVNTGHVQYTAPYIRSGGGPGGWGCAIVEVPYRFWKFYGDAGPFAACWPGMLRYFDYLEQKSVNGLVAADKPGEWCLGDWCTPETMILPPPFVNTYFYIRSLLRCIELAPRIGKTADLPLLQSRLAARRQALQTAYFDPMTESFLGGRQGADAFALDIGLGSEKTYRNLVNYYTALGGYDTGIFGTDLVTRILFQGGDAQLAVRLLTSESEHSFAGMRRRGATTLWEYFPGSLRDRSHSHPMFGAVAAYPFEYILGIRQPEGEAGFRTLELAPSFPPSLRRAAGYRVLPAGRVEVSWAREGEAVRLEITLPQGLPAVLALGEKRIPLKAGKNMFTGECNGKYTETV